MPEPVRCDICGKLYSSSHVKSHKRLAHSRQKPAAVADDAIHTIVEIFGTLSPENQTRVLAQLSMAKEGS